ncbi:monooxygenase [Aspergillus sclerotioniger CBS 115572]|uniref:Monooxygenase n=1 Tax=Aspergillus sclerotioniger CBS 115572 TaxID=1450535 RepID=A0A317V7B6_9EURO|nr:monooxygenase [Aspergillus sclerotioniger CBS 115572]PWY68948.1 monooxygenase [Aspergillus sclerotioniger CBS 115572]
MTTNRYNIIIIGAGIAGLAAAISLRTRTRTILLLEQSPLNTEIGATISLQPNASKIVLQRWNLASLLAPHSMTDTAFEVYNLAGELKTHVPLSSSKEKYGAERMIYHRQDLHSVLKHRTTAQEYPGDPATLWTGRRVVSVNCEEGIVEMESGEKVYGDLIIGADGIKSVVRGCVLGREVQARTTGWSAYRMMVDMEDLVRNEGFVGVVDPRVCQTVMVVGDGRRRIIMGPARGGKVYSVVALVADEKGEVRKGTSWVTAGDRGMMLDTFGDFPEWATAPLRLARGRGRVILIGDAAHAMLPTQGQGGSQAIEDAEALGAFFEGFEAGRWRREDVERVNREVFECRFTRASTIQEYSRLAGGEEDGAKVAMNPREFMDYNCLYEGAVEWRRRQGVVHA